MGKLFQGNFGAFSDIVLNNKNVGSFREKSDKVSNVFKTIQKSLDKGFLI